MKKTAAYIVLCCYLLMTTGVVAVSHYCMDRLASVSLFTATEKKCGKCGMKKEKNGCCEDKETLLKVSSDHNKVPALSFHVSIATGLPYLITDFLLTKLQNGVYRFDHMDRPPPLADTAIYIKNEVFRI